MQRGRSRASAARGHGLPARRPPAQARKARVVAVESDPLATLFNGKGSEPRVAHPRAARLGRCAEALEDAPVTLTRLDHFAMRLTEEVVAIPQSLFDIARVSEGARIGGDANDRAQRQR